MFLRSRMAEDLEYDGSGNGVGLEYNASRTPVGFFDRGWHGLARMGLQRAGKAVFRKAFSDPPPHGFSRTKHRPRDFSVLVLGAVLRRIVLSCIILHSRDWRCFALLIWVNMVLRMSHALQTADNTDKSRCSAPWGFPCTKHQCQAPPTGFCGDGAWLCASTQRFIVVPVGYWCLVCGRSIEALSSRPFFISIPQFTIVFNIWMEFVNVFGLSRCRPRT